MTNKLELGARISIPVSCIEFDVGGHTLWVQSPEGATVLRIKMMGRIQVEACNLNPVSHLDIQAPGDLIFCLADDAA